MYTPKYSISNKILKNIGIIEACREVVDHAPLLPYYEKEFQKDALVRTVHHGTHIEGNELDLTQAERAIFGQEIVARARDVQEVINYRNVMEYLGKIKNHPSADGSKIKNEVDEEFIKNLHRMIVEKIIDETRCGAYRTTQVVVRNSLTGEVTFTPPIAAVIDYEIKALLEFIEMTGETEIHPVLKGGAVHYELVRIHPFVDGNGRVARVLSTFILNQHGYDIRRFFSLEEYFDRDAASYYASLQSVEKNSGDLTEWLVFH